MDYEAMIRAQATAGQSLEDIAKSLNDALNKIQQEEKAKAAKKTEKQEYIDAVEESYHLNYRDEAAGINDVTALALLVMQGVHPDWTIENCKEFREKMEMNLRVTADMQGKSLCDAIKAGIDTALESMPNKDKITTFTSSIKEDDDWKKLMKWIEDL